MFAAGELTKSGFSPDLVVAHCGWGETLPLSALFPRARFIVYCEFYYRAEGQDVHFDPASPRLGPDGVAALQAKNASTLLALTEAHGGLSPTHWQRSTYPSEFRSKIRVAHEGVDVERLAPDPAAAFALPDGRVLTRRDEVVTYVSRNLEPLRGFPVFLRAVPEILKRRPQAIVIIAGGDGVSYSHAAPGGKSWKSVCLEEMRDKLDLSRVVFLDRLPYDAYLRLLQVSSTHVYLTYPFVLSWSLIEAMSVGCALVASDTAPVREVVAHGYNGLLTPFADADALAQAVAETLADRKGQAERGRAARRAAIELFDKRRCTAEALAAIGARASLRLAS
jgi:glycosyltransferase involved in cell wall biosynthesis